MLGLMQDWPLTVDKILDRAASYFGDTEIVTRRTDGAIHRTNYAEVHARARQVSGALRTLGITAGDRVATLAWNSERHMESWYGAMGIGAVLHTLNPRLHPQQLAWIINHAADRVLIFDTTFLPLVEAVREQISVEHYVIIADPSEMPENQLGAICYEEWIAAANIGTAWGGFDENSACGLCYTSGTTGNPKGVLYSHRSNVIHAMISLSKDCFDLGSHDTVMPVVPMFHANAWALAFAGPMAGAKMVMPGPGLDGRSIHEMLTDERVTLTAAVPTLWMGLLEYMRANKLDLPWLKRVCIGGSAIPERILRAFEEDYGVEVGHAWGMTECSPIGSVSHVPRGLVDAPFEKVLPHKMAQGIPLFGTELRVVGSEGDTVARGSGDSGNLQIRGVAVVSSYFGGDGGDILDENDWFDTGDLASVDEEGAIRLTDRSKDVIKSGGEWISSIDLENAVISHPQVANAAAIAIPNDKWGERPLLIIQPESGLLPSEDDLREFLTGRIASWWMPDEFRFVEAIPLGATGKVNKLKLRKMYADGELAAG